MVLLGVLGIGAGFALANGGPPTPAIGSHPGNPTTSTSASFSFTDSKAGSAFICSFDGSSFSACTSAKTYTGLGQGGHTFRVEAKDSSGHTSDAAAYSWTIDLTPPAITVWFPANGVSYGAAAWNWFAGVCGSADDPSGVSAVVVSVRSPSGKYWNGTTFGSSSEQFVGAVLTKSSGETEWRLPLPLPATNGVYTVHVRATDGLGNATPSGAPASSSFTIDTVPPPVPSITGKPDNPTRHDSADFSFTDSEAAVGYLCRLDGGAYKPCSTPRSYSGLHDGSHTFFVVATDAAGNISGPVSYTWVIDTRPPAAPTITSHPANPSSSSSGAFSFTDSSAGTTFECKLDNHAWQSCTSPTTYTGLSVDDHEFSVRAVDAVGNRSDETDFHWRVSQSSGMSFTISGDVAGLLYPGAGAQPVAVRLTNPNSVPIFVTALTATVQSVLPSGCAASSFQITQSSVSSTQTVQVPANGSLILPAQGATAPAIHMLDTGSNQDACKNAKLTLGYTGSAHS